VAGLKRIERLTWQDNPVLLDKRLQGCALKAQCAGGTAIDILGCNIDEVLLAEAPYVLPARRFALRTVSVSPATRAQSVA
jgi:hypothetical protein